MRDVVVVGASIAGVTAASTLRAEGYSGRLTVLSEESRPPYSRVPLSKGVLGGTQDPGTTALPALPDDVELRLGSRATALRTERHLVELEGADPVPYDGLVIATGSRARRLGAPGQRGELVVRTLEDAEAIARRVPGARTALVVGGGFLGMEVASTLNRHGLAVTVVDRDPPLRRLVGSWLADLVVARASGEGITFASAPDGVELVGDPVRGAAVAGGAELHADIVVSAVGDLPNVEWLQSSGLTVAGGLVVDASCRVAQDVVAAGDVTVVEVSPGVFRREPHWTSAVVQARAAAHTLLHGAGEPYQPDHYFWTEQFGLDLKMAGRLPFTGAPRVSAGDPVSGSALMEWYEGERCVGAVAMNHRMPVVRLKAMARAA